MVADKLGSLRHRSPFVEICKLGASAQADAPAPEALSPRVTIGFNFKPAEVACSVRICTALRARYKRRAYKVRKNEVNFANILPWPSGRSVQPFAVLGALEAGLDYDFFSEILLNPAPEQQHTHA